MQHALVTAIVLLCVQALGAVVWVAWRWASQTPARPERARRLEGPTPSVGIEPASPDEPAAPSGLAVLLVHGFLGFDSIGFGRARIHYFRRIARCLEQRGVDVIVARLPPLGGTPARALALQAQIARIASPHIVIVAHSLGGLDARWALARGDATRVRALITIGTPHRGTPIADAFARGPAGQLRRALARLGFGTDAVDWLTTERLARFNDEVPDVPGVRYASIVAATADRRRVHPLLRVTHAYLSAHGPSDGVVPGASQVWGDVLEHAELDHWGQVGWSGGHDAAALVERALEAVTALPPAPRLLPAPRRLSSPSAA